MNKKAAIELSMNFLVVLIIAIVVFGMGIFVFQKVFKQAKDFHDTIDAQTEERMLKQMIGAGDLVKVINSQEKVSKGKTKIFYLGIKNDLGSPQDFHVYVHRVDPTLSRTYTQTDSPWGDGTTYAFEYTAGPITLQNKEGNIRMLMLTVPKNVLAGTYVFNVAVCVNTPVPDNELVSVTPDADNCGDANYYRYSRLQKIYLTVP
ncbi:MAG: hypothetical protein V1659_00810 [Candidatus Woesearchaeota archaeon]